MYKIYLSEHYWSMKLSAFLQSLMPPLLYAFMLKQYKAARKNQFLYWEETSGTWSDALAKCSGYSEDSILEKVEQATRAVVSGEASYERDSVLFFTHEYNLPLLAGLQEVYRDRKRLHVVDFGGALGSTYHQNRKILDKMQAMHWTIVEQENYVKNGRANFTSEFLSFEYSLNDIAFKPIDVIVFSCVLHYLENPFSFIEKAVQNQIPFLLIDRTPFNQVDNDLLTIQHVPEKIYKANYVCRIFAEEKFMKKMAEHYELIWSYDNNIQIGIPCVYKGMLFRLKALPN